MGDVVGSIAGSAFEVLLRNLISLCEKEIGLVQNFKKDLDKLKESLEMIQAFLNDAEMKQTTNLGVKCWLIKLEAVAFDADNVIDKLNYKVHLRKMGPGNKLKKKVRAYFSTRKIGLEIRSISEKLKSINERATEFGLQQLRAHVPSVESNLTLTQRETASNPDPVVVGRENDVSSIVEELTQDDQQEVFSVLPILGMGGLGKTTLAKLVFHDKKIEAHFQKRIWVYVSQLFDENTLFKKILESVTGSSTDDLITKNALLRNLGENLEAQKFLLVLDDVWMSETKKWNDFVNNLSSITSVKGNGIIVTTRSETVASIMGTTHIQTLRHLPDEDCWSIIKEKTFGKGCVIPDEFEAIGRTIANKCNGLPLIANVVGGLLRGKSKNEWCSIVKEELSNMGEDGNTVMKILKLSFDNLSSQSLKKCFAFCAIFPKGYWIGRERLIFHWMVEGFLQSDREDMETLANKYIDLLLHNSLLQVGERLYNGNIEYFTMHDHVHDVASSILCASGPARWIYSKSITDISREEARHARLLIFEGEISHDNMLSNFENLRGLVLVGDGNKQLPKIEHLIHLRYLDIVDTKIEFSPKLMDNLYLLLVFRARIASNKLPTTLTKLVNLRHVYVRGIEETRAETQLDHEVVASPSLGCLEFLHCQKSATSATTRFPELETLCIDGMHSSLLLENLLVNTTSLTRLQFDELQGLVCLPDMFFDKNQKLTCVKIFDCRNLTHLPPRFGVSLREAEITCCLDLEGLPENPHSLDKLTLYSCPNIRSIPYNPSSGFHSLRELTISDCGVLSELPIGLLESCASSLESVCLMGLTSLTNMGMVIACLQKMPRLTSLKVDLKHLATDDFPIEIVGSFDSLRELWITCGMKIWQRLQDLLQHLNALRELRFSDIEMEAVPEWLGNLTSLRELHLYCCPQLRSLPSRKALKHLTTLRVEDCPLLNMRRDDDNSEWHKLSHVVDVYPYQV